MRARWILARGGDPMKSMVLQAGIAGAVAIAAGALAAPVSAATLRYTFGTVSGGVYCDGLTLTTTDRQTYTGEHTGCGGDVPADGRRVHGHGGSHLNVKTTSPGDDTVFTFFLYLRQKQWVLYVNINGVREEINSGVLIKGAPANNGRPSQDTDPRALRDRVF
jgi:hypothetical protein